MHITWCLCVIEHIDAPAAVSMLGRCIRALQQLAARGLALQCGSHALTAANSGQDRKQAGWKQKRVWNGVCAKSEGRKS